MRQGKASSTDKRPANEAKIVLNLGVGDWIDVMDAEGTWNVAQVLSIPSPKEIEVQYDGWPKEFNEIVQLNSDRVAPYHTYTWSVKCWAKYKNWPWWPAIVTIRAPGTEEGIQYLRSEKRLFVDFLDRKLLNSRCRCWVEKSKITPFEDHYGDRRKRTTGSDFESSLALALKSSATEKFPKFVKGTLPTQFRNAVADPVKTMKKAMGMAMWANSFSNNRMRHARVYSYTANGDDGDSEDDDNIEISLFEEEEERTTPRPKAKPKLKTKVKRLPSSQQRQVATHDTDDNSRRDRYHSREGSQSQRNTKDVDYDYDDDKGEEDDQESDDSPIPLEPLPRLQTKSKRSAAAVVRIDESPAQPAKRAKTAKILEEFNRALSKDSSISEHEDTIYLSAENISSSDESTRKASARKSRAMNQPSVMASEPKNSSRTHLKSAPKATSSSKLAAIAKVRRSFGQVVEEIIDDEDDVRSSGKNRKMSEARMEEKPLFNPPSDDELLGDDNDDLGQDDYDDDDEETLVPPDPLDDWDTARRTSFLDQSISRSRKKTTTIADDIVRESSQSNQSSPPNRASIPVQKPIRIQSAKRLRDQQAKSIHGKSNSRGSAGQNPASGSDSISAKATGSHKSKADNKKKDAKTQKFVDKQIASALALMKDFDEDGDKKKTKTKDDQRNSAGSKSARTASSAAKSSQPIPSNTPQSGLLSQKKLKTSKHNARSAVQGDANPRSRIQAGAGETSHALHNTARPRNPRLKSSVWVQPTPKFEWQERGEVEPPQALPNPFAAPNTLESASPSSVSSAFSSSNGFTMSKWIKQNLYTQFLTKNSGV
ncbi:hypothetical protein Poli38472_002509 [Pythium oligandrum]|uniref:PWWP domain-containing protein n=1 Tax=Pythium oligandrum TaxID=41045 RepID=A0A8K1FME3_PYTOL|nr:hypothetical protein Poli38472_002509 [Pythium oligandrum]|eukprot:TMW63568.1 hypothetical protein Poli38472_002509 [Pythium oligandrum]